MRCFIAVDLDDKLKPEITKLQQQIKNYDVKLVEEQNLHFTLKFLGDVPDSTLTKVKTALAEVAGSAKPFEITLKGAVLYPTEKYVRVIFVDTVEDELMNLHIKINETLSKLFKKEKVRPHLTLARVRSAKDNKKLVEFVRRHNETEFGKVLVGKFVLKKSVLTPKGPVYEDIAEFRLVG